MPAWFEYGIVRQIVKPDLLYQVRGAELLSIRYCGEVIVAMTVTKNQVSNRITGWILKNGLNSGQRFG